MSKEMENNFIAKQITAILMRVMVFEYLFKTSNSNHYLWIKKWVPTLKQNNFVCNIITFVKNRINKGYERCTKAIYMLPADRNFPQVTIRICNCTSIAPLAKKPISLPKLERPKEKPGNFSEIIMPKCSLLLQNKSVRAKQQYQFWADPYPI